LLPHFSLVPVVYASSILEATTDNQHSFAGLLSSYHLLVSYNGTYVVGRSSSGSSEEDFEYPNFASVTRYIREE
jgi:hypothetical protein